MPTKQHRSTEQIRNLVETILHAMVEHEAHVQIHEVRGEHNVVFEIKVHETDVGHVIGVQGKNAEAIRTILNAACKKLHVKYTLDIITKDRRTA